MYAGHFAAAILLHTLYPTAPLLSLTLGTGWLDLLFGVFAYFGYEGISPSDNAGYIGVNLHCPHSHSLLASLILSALWSLQTPSAPLAPFLAAFSHFPLDWAVHNKDLYLDPFSHILIGGTELWSKSPWGAYYLEAIFLAVCVFYSIYKPEKSLLGRSVIAAVGAYVVYLHTTRKPEGVSGFRRVADTVPEEKRGPILLKVMFKVFGLPALWIAGGLMIAQWL